MAALRLLRKLEVSMRGFVAWVERELTEVRTRLLSARNPRLLTSSSSGIRTRVKRAHQVLNRIDCLALHPRHITLLHNGYYAPSNALRPRNQADRS